MARIGIMGGTFNPIHLGHITIAKAAYEQFHLDEVWFMPNHIPDYKSDQQLVSGKNRLAMVSLAIQNTPYFKASDFELQRQGNTYTAETLMRLAEKYPKDSFYFIMGADSLFYFERWRNPEIIVHYATVLAAPREEHNKQKVLKRAEELNRLFEGNYFYLIDCPEISCSSREIRETLIKMEHTGKPTLCSELHLPKQVYQYILENRLYMLNTSVQ